MSEVSTEQIQQYIRSVLEREREPVRAGEFVLYVHRSDQHPYLNYAIPAPTARRDDGSALVRAAQERGLVPRLEYLEECFPWVEAALAENGFVREGRLRLMSCAHGTVPEAHAAASGGLELIRVHPGSALVEPMLAVTHSAFGEPPPRDDVVARWEGRAIAAVAGSAVLGSAGWTMVVDGMSEIVGVAVDDAARRRGIGTALTIAAARAAFAEGASYAFLTPGDDNTARVYERAGFSDATTMIHLRRGGR